MSLARLVLTQSALAGLRVLFWSEEAGCFRESSIQGYVEERDCFVLLDEASGARHALQFHRFTVEERQAQLVLRVTACAPAQLPETPPAADRGVGDPALYPAAAPEASTWDAAADGAADGPPRQPSVQLSAELSRKLSGLVGHSFSHTDEGFEVLALADAELSDGAAGAAAPPAPAPVQAPAARGEGRPAADGAPGAEEADFWGSPVRGQESANPAAAATTTTDPPSGDACVAAEPAPGPPPGAKVAGHSDALPPCGAEEAGVAEAGAASQHVAGMAPAGGSLGSSPAASFSSFRQISRMISAGGGEGGALASTGGTPSDSARRKSGGSAGGGGAPGLAARLLEEDRGTWGTPRDGSSGGLTSEQQQQQLQEGQQHQRQQQAGGDLPWTDSSGDVGQPKPAPQVGDAAPAPAAAAAVGSGGGQSSSFGDLDFTIAAAVDACPCPLSRPSRSSSRELYRIPSSDATDAGMMVDIPQPLSSRRASRTSARNLHTLSDAGLTPGGHHHIAHGGGGGAASAAAAATSGAGGGELRRATSSMGGRRISRSTSSRINADQDWAILGPDGQPMSQLAHGVGAGGGGGGSGGGGGAHLAAAPDGQLHAAGALPPLAAASLHVPSPTSRRTSRTLSGRVPLDQDGTAAAAGPAAVAVQQLDDAEPDVLARPAAAAPMVLDAATSRRVSANGRPGTPDSDGFGYSEFEGIEPLVPPELAQWDAIAEEAAHADSAAAAAGGHGHHHRHQRRSIRNMGAPSLPPPLAPVPRAPVRLSDQDDHSSQAAAAAPVAAAPAQLLRQLSSGRLANQVIEGSLPAGEVAAVAAAAAAAAAAVAAETEGGSGKSSGSGSAAGSRRSTRRSVSGILQAAAAVAAAAEAAAAAAVGYALGGRGTAEEQQVLEVAAAAAASAALSPLAPAGSRDGGASAAYLDFAAAPALERSALPQDSFVLPDSFSCPPFMPLAGGGAGSASAGGGGGGVTKSGLNPFASAFSFGSSQPPSSASTTSVFAIGTAVAPEEALDDPRLPLSLAPPSPGSPGSMAAALLRKQQQLLPPAASMDGSEWGSAATLGPHIASAAIDSPTGSAVFRSNPFAEAAAASGNEGGSEPATPREAQALPPVSAKAGLGASRMGREAAAALPFAGLGAGWATKGSAGGVSISEITPASEDDESGGEKIGSYRSGSAAAAARACEPPAGGALTAAAMAAQAAAIAAAAAASGAVGRATPGVRSWPLPPSYAESVGADADDESSPCAPEAAAVRGAWPGAHRIAVSSSSGSGGGGGVRHGAELDDGCCTSAATAATSRRTSGGSCSEQLLPEARGREEQQQQAAAAAAAAPLAEGDQVGGGGGTLRGGGGGGGTGLVRRAVSRTPSQALSNGAAMSLDGLVLLPGPTYNNYEDDDHRPLVQQWKGQGPQALQEARAQIGRVVLGQFLANSVQWFDSLAFVVLGNQLMAAMSPASKSAQWRLAALFAVFAAGHVLWFAGCLLWPWAAGRFGRRAVLAWTVGLSVFPTALLGCLPAYSEGGAAGLVAIAALRFLAGVSLGNEAPAAAVYLAERAPQLANLHASLVPCAMAAGALGAASTALFFSWVLSPESLGIFGWRLTLAASLVANVVSGGLRGFVLRDPEESMSAAELADRRNGHVSRVLRHHAAQLPVVAGMAAFASSGLFLLCAWMPAYLTELTGLPANLALTLHTANMAALAAAMPLGGFIADRFGRTTLLLATCAAAALAAYPAWLLLSLSVAAISWFAELALAVIVGLHWGALPAAMIERFPPGVRCSGLTLALVLPMVALGTAAPLMALGFVARTHTLASPAALMIVMAVASGATIAATKLPALQAGG